MTRDDRSVTLNLPNEFIELCKYDMVCPVAVLREFIADVCSISQLGCDPSDRYLCNLSEDRDRAKAYYDRLHGWKAEWLRENLPNYVKRWEQAP
jgi:hypothetical protein